MSYTLQAQQQPARPVLFVHTRTPVTQLPQTLGQAYAQVAAFLAAKGEQPAGPPYVAYYNMNMEDLEIDAGFLVSHEFQAEGEIRCGEIPAGNELSCFYTGSYQELNVPYEAMDTWMKEHQVEPTGLVYEFYLNDPETTAPENLQTQIIFPLK